MIILHQADCCAARLPPDPAQTSMTEHPASGSHCSAGPRQRTRRKLAFAGIATLAFFVVAEVVLALFGVRPPVADQDPYVGFESRIPLYAPETIEGRMYWRTAENKLDFFNPQRFLQEKPANTVRVFCLGGSTTFGRPFDDRTSFAAWLRELLPLTDPSKRWEIINAGGISYASYRVAGVMEELAAYSPDLFVVYTGHNEFLEQRTYGDIKGSPPLLRTLTAPLLHSRTAGVMRGLVSRDRAKVDRGTLLPGEVDAVLDHSAGPSVYQRDEQLHRDVLEHFRFNLDRMVDIARKADADLVFVTPAANLKDFSPFKSSHRRGLDDEQLRRWEQHVAEAGQLHRSGNFEAALSQWNTAKQIDGHYAALHYRMGQTLVALGRGAEARQAFQDAIDHDICPLRAVGEIQAAIEQNAIKHRVPLVDFRSILDGACRETYGHDSPGNEYFLDHVHPTTSANRLLALAIVNAMSRRGITAAGAAVTDQAIGLAGERILSRVDTELQARALTNLAQVLSWAGKQAEAGPIAVEAVRLRSAADLKDDPESLFYAAVNWATSGRDAEAMALFRRVLQLEPNHFAACWRLAALLYDHGDYKASREHFRKAVQLNPQHAYSFQMLGASLLKLERYEDALAAWNRAAELDPDDDGLRENISLVREKIRGG